MKTDIIIPVWNQFSFTKDCIESVFGKTNFAFHLIIIDNASSEPTKGYLDKLVQDRKDTVTLLRNEKNLGFVKAVNQGIKESKAPYVCLLNNDTRVTKGWLTEMVKLAKSKEDIGIVNPNSNTLGCKPKKGKSLETFVRELKSYTGEYSELAWTTGFCMFIKRKVIQEVGLFDEIYGMGNFEDADFCKRAQRLGYICVCAKAAYVYHHERRSFIKLKMFDQDFQRNRQIFYAKWGRTKRILYILAKDKPVYTEKVGQDALRLAREGNMVWLFLSSRIDFPIPYKGKVLKDEDKRKYKKHSNIYVYSLPKHFFNLVSLWRILTRKKKFDKIYVDDENYAKRLNNLKPLHKAKVDYVQ